MVSNTSLLSPSCVWPIRLTQGLLTALAVTGCAILKPPAPTPVAVAVAAPAPGASASAVPSRFVSAVTPAAAGASAPAAGRPDAVPVRPFDDVVKGATQQAGFVPVWRKDEKVWLELPVERLDQPFMLSINVSHSVGERGLYGGQMGPSWLVMFRKRSEERRVGKECA